MKLTKVQVTEFKSVRDSGEFQLGDITCLVGKNEAGKTALLQALYRLNPIVAADNKFDVTDDYPRSEVEDYRQQVEEDQREPAEVIQATFSLDDSDLKPIQETFGDKVIRKPEFSLSRGYSNTTHFSLATREQDALRSLFAAAQVTPELSAALTTSSSVDAATEILKTSEQTEEVKRLNKILTRVKERGLNGYIYDTYLDKRLPKFFYFDEYYQMKGFENIEALIQREEAKTPEPSDHPMLGLIELARLKLSELLNPQRTQELVNKLEAAGNHLGKKVLKYWSQNRHLQTRFDVRPA